jgi:hypothetical protein
MQVFVLAGQSNMAGRGHLDIDSESDVRVDHLVFALEGFGETSEWRPAKDPIHQWIDNDELRIKCGSVSRTKPGVESRIVLPL